MQYVSYQPPYSTSNLNLSSQFFVLSLSTVKVFPLARDFIPGAFNSMGIETSKRKWSWSQIRLSINLFHIFIKSISISNNPDVKFTATSGCPNTASVCLCYCSLHILLSVYACTGAVQTLRCILVWWAAVLP